MAVPVAPYLVDRYRVLVGLLLPRLRSRGRRRGEAATRASADGATSAAALERYVAGRLASRSTEALLCLFYGDEGTIRAESLFEGCVSQIVASRTQLAARAIEHGARFVVIAHNHPGGIAAPSDQDVHATRQVYRLFAALGMTLADHVIVTGSGSSFSFRRAGLL